ncbi:Positive regulator of purine utilization [Vanrija pseudolonga]|uniref:Positive regulator of purine utilization n=1 Tax=Vanrija pseudolonga TaxID=143232 RepID=A0AAF0Y0E5_9TREE|nr:Positive regulator of purine utilization [Vanrija pseudolonga]
MKVPTERRTSSDTSHYSPYPTSSNLPPSFSQPAPPVRSNSSVSRGSPSAAASVPDQTQYKVARAISSCTRCRSRKQKCDGKLPACSACERAKVECIGFDAISKTNVSRNYLHQLEQEVAQLRAQVAALSTPGQDPVGRTKREIASNASQAIATFASLNGSLAIDPALQGPDGEPPMRSPWDSSPSVNARSRSEYGFPQTPLGGHDSPSGSPIVPGGSLRSNPITASTGAAATSLTRMVQDAALRTGHAITGATLLNSTSTNGPPSVSGSVRAGESPSDRGSFGKDSPAVGDHDREEYNPSPETTLTPRSAHPSLPANVPHTRGPPSVSSVTGGPAPSVSSAKSRVRRAFHVPPLPPQPAVERLVAAYVDFVGVTAPIIHIPTLGKQLQRMREGTDVDESDVFVVMMVLALSTMASSRFVDPPDELRACSEAFHAEALKHLDAVFEAQSYIGLQAILLLVWYSLLNPDKGSIWFLVGLATRTCVDLGFHNSNNAQAEKLDNLEIDMRRRLFWITYKMDRLLSQSLGRPPGIPDGFIHVPMPALQHDVDIHAGSFGPLTGEACPYKAVFAHTVKLRQLQSEILNNTYGVNGMPKPKPEWFDDMFERLKDWLARSPEPRGTVSSEGYAISFHNSCLLLFRPSRGNPKPGRAALATVLASSSYIIRIYRRMQLNNRISWLWMTSHFSFMAGLSFLYAFSNLYSLGGGAGVPTLDEAMMDIESCLAVLESLSPRVPSASACHDTMRSVSQSLFQQLSKMSPPRHEVPGRLSPGGRFRGAPISSSRDDPLPNDAPFPAPLPPTTLPYELTLLDNLFLNPMSSHNKASEYTNGPKSKNCKKVCGENGLKNGEPSAASPGMPQSLPPAAFHSFGPYGIAAQVASGAAASSNNGPSWPGGQTTAQAVALGATATSSNALNELTINGILGNATPTANGGGAATPGVATNGVAADGAVVDPATTFDIFSFLMDEEGGLGQSWNALDVPADYPLWS